MKIVEKHSGLYTDHYELTMAQGYFLEGRKDVQAGFDYFFRKAPFDSSYVVFAGLSDLLQTLEQLAFQEEDCSYLASKGFNKDFLTYLINFKFKGNIYAPEEGELVFPYEPVVRVEGNIIETQIIETLLLNILNFESLIATKASRLRQVAGNKLIFDFGLRRAQGLGGIHASKAAIIGGVNSTSNVYSAYTFNLPSSGTQAHSWIESYDNELTAFRAFARIYPDNCVLLIDTYDTLRSGLANAIKVAKEMEHNGHKLYGLRIDSGDLTYLSKKVRTALDHEGLDYVRIIASNKLDEYVIKSLLEQKAPIDIFGVGTRLVTGKGDAALDGVYKLSTCNDKPRLKISEELKKITIPGNKKIFRMFDDHGDFYGDAIVLEEENDVEFIFHPFQSYKFSNVKGFYKEPILKKVMDLGIISCRIKNPMEISLFVSERLKMLPEEFKRFTNPAIYKVGISKRLLELRTELINTIKQKVDEQNIRY